jgi:hypothetical protein
MTRRVIWVTITTEPPTLPTDIVMDSFPVYGHNTELVDPRGTRIGENLEGRIHQYVDDSEEPPAPPDEQL